MNYKAFSLIESLMSMTILSVAMIIAFMCVGWIMNSSSAALELRAKILLENISMEAKVNKRYFDEVIMDGGFSIEKKLIPIIELKSCYRLELRAIDINGKQIYASTNLVYIN